MDNCHDHSCKLSSVFQTLDELDFERGIWYAAQNNDFDRIQKLLSKGVHIDQCDNAGYTALHYAARAGHLDLVKYLLSKGANINAITKSGKATALHRAVTAGKHEIVHFLINNNANLKIKDSDGKTILHRAAEANDLQMCKEISTICGQLENEVDCKQKVPLDYFMYK